MSLPLGVSAPVLYTPKGIGQPGIFRNADGSTSSWNESNIQVASSSIGQSPGRIYDGDTHILNYDPNGTLKVDLSNATAATVADLRQVFQLQSLVEC